MKLLAISQEQHVRQLRRLALKAKAEGECRYWREVNAEQYLIAKRDMNIPPYLSRYAHK